MSRIPAQPFPTNQLLSWLQAGAEALEKHRIVHSEVLINLGFRREVTLEQNEVKHTP